MAQAHFLYQVPPTSPLTNDIIQHHESTSDDSAVTCLLVSGACVRDLTRHRLWGTCNNRTMDPTRELQYEQSYPTREFFRKGTIEKTIKYPISAICPVWVCMRLFRHSNRGLITKGTIGSPVGKRPPFAKRVQNICMSINKRGTMGGPRLPVFTSLGVRYAK